MTRLVARNSYKYPLLIGLPEFFRKNLFKGGKRSDSQERFLKFITGISVSFLEAMITCPIDRLKVHMMTQ